MSKLSKETITLIEKYEHWYNSAQEKKENPIHVDEVASQVAAFYEKIRGIIDWKEEHLLKRSVVERSLKRRVFTQLNPVNGFSKININAEDLVLELIRSGHFPNNQIPYEKIKKVQDIINKYLFILNSVETEKIQITNWLCSIGACEIEQTLNPSLKQRGLINYMYAVMKKRVQVQEKIISFQPLLEKERKTQLYIAIQRALFNLDEPFIAYQLFQYKYQNYSQKELAEKIFQIKEEIEKNLNHNLKDYFYQVCEKYDTPFLLIGDVLEENPEKIKEIFNNTEFLEIEIKKAYNKRLKTLKKRIGRAAIYSTLSIFLSNIVALIAIEYPITQLLNIEFPLIAIVIDILVPTFLMALLVVTVNPPPKNNLEKVIMETIKMIYEPTELPVYPIKAMPQTGLITKTIITLFYSLAFLTLLGLIVWGLYLINFPPLSYFIFIIFLSLIAFSGMKIRKSAKELHMVEDKQSPLFIFIDPFALPIIQLGKWLANRWKKYNVISLFFSSLIDMPFLSFVRFLEQWRYFLKKQKDKIY